MNLDWKWIAFGFLIMLGLSIVAGIVLAAILGSQLEGVTSAEVPTLSSGQMTLAAVLNVLVFALGGFIVGLKSAGRTIWEPAIAAAIAVAGVLLLSRQFTLGNLFLGGLVPFLAGLLGGWLGEKRQASRTLAP